MSEHVTGLVERLERVERQCDGLRRQTWRLRSLNALLIAGLAASFLLSPVRPSPAEPGPSAGRTLEGEKLILRDSGGKVRLECKAAPSGASIRISGVEGKAGMELVVADTGSGFRFIDDQGQVRAGLLLTDDAGSLLLYSRDRKQSAALGSSGLIIRDEREKPRASLDVKPDSASLTLCDGQGQGRAALEVDVKNVPRLVLRDAAGQMRTVLCVTKDGPGVSLFDEKGNPSFTKP